MSHKARQAPPDRLGGGCPTSDETLQSWKGKHAAGPHFLYSNGTIGRLSFSLPQGPGGAAGPHFMYSNGTIGGCSFQSTMGRAGWDASNVAEPWERSGEHEQVQPIARR